ncbi:MAG TPA: GEVED domain-containing protein, partial [Bacteroidia bacterium]|nr:GEVED domain-containing protein [Bacteroidia bacterium]
MKIFTHYFKKIFLGQFGWQKKTSVLIPLFVFGIAISSKLIAQTNIFVGTGTNVPSVGTNPGSGANGASPYGYCTSSGAMGKKMQIIYTAAQINAAMTAAGYTPGSSYIHHITWDISTNTGNAASHLNYTIKMANVVQSQFATTASAYAGASTTVWGPSTQAFPSSGTGFLVTFTLGTPFQWDGTSNLLVEVCYTATTPFILTTYGGCRRTATASNQIIYNGGAAINCATSTYASVVAAIPNARLGVTSATPCSGTPAIATVSSATPCTGTSAILNLSGLPGASGYTYLWKQSNSSTYPGTFTAASGTNNNASYTTPTTLPFTPTYYVCEVTCTNSGQTTPSTAGTVNYNTFLNCYCTGTYAAANAGTRGITNVGIAAPASPIINNASTVLNGGAGATSYTLYTGSSPISNAGLALSASYTLAVKVGSQAAASNNVGAWIDYNQNGTFETSEFLGSFSNAAANSTTNINFTVPGTAISGITAMRVRHRYGGAVTSADPCTNFTGTAGAGGAGETEDYRVNITGTACSGTPTAGNVYAGSSGTNTTASVCPSNTATMYATGFSSGVSGISLQWQSATAPGGPYSNVVGGSGATTPNYTTPTLTNAGLTAIHLYYKCLVTCTNGGATDIQTTPVDITINPTPSVTVNGSGPYSTSICNTGSPNNVVLTASNAASGTTTWSWSPATGLSATNVANPTANPSTTTTYTVTATANSCAGNTTATVTVNPTTVVTTATPATISLGQSSALTAISSSSNGVISYTWSPATSLYVDAGLTTPYNLGDNVQNVYTNTLSTAVYTVTATDPSGCSNSSTVTVSVSSGSPGTTNCSYGFSYTTSAYAAISGATTLASGIVDNAVYTNVPIGFTFNFNDAPYSSFGVSSNTFIWFGTGTCSSTQFTPLSSTVGQTGNVDGIVSVFGMDNYGYAAGSKISYRTTGAVGSRICTIEWLQYVTYKDDGSSCIGFSWAYPRADFQIKLYEGSNKIEFHYFCASYDLTAAGIGGQVGIRGSTVTDFNTRAVACGGNWASSAAGTASSVCYISGGGCCTQNWPANNATYVYTPTIKPTITPTGQQNICTGSSVLLTAVNSGGMSSPSYQWQTYAWPPSNSNIGGQTSSTYNANPGAAGNYFYTVKLTSGSCSRNSDAVAVVVASCNTITTTDVASQLCAGGAVNVLYTASGSFTGGNVFTAQLSDATGSFTSPITIGSVVATASGSIACIIPSNTPVGLGYQIRVISSTPALTGTPNTAFEVLEPAPIISVTNPTAGCAPGTVDITAIGVVSVTNGVTVSGITYWDNAGATIAYSGSPSAVSTISTIYVKYENACGSDVEPIDVTFNNPIIASHSNTNPSSCAGNNGTITLNGLSPLTSYTVVYQKNGPPNINAGSISTNAGGNLIITGLGDGTYDSFVLTRLGCSSAAYPISPANIILTDPTPPVISGNSSINPTTCSSTDGSITLTGLNASTTYNVTYDKNTATINAGSIATDASGNLQIINLGDGIYENIYVTLGGCNSAPVPSSGTIILTPPSSPVITSATSSDPSTCSGFDGSIQLSGLAPSSVYTVTYIKNITPINGGSVSSNGSGVLTISGLTQGAYSNLVVTNALGCFSNTYPLVGNITLVDPPQPTISSFVANDPIICGGNGSITLEGLLNSTAYNVSYKKNGGSSINAGAIITNGSGQLIVTGLGYGDYDNFIVTLNNCASDPYPISGSITLVEPPIPTDAIGIPASICGTNALLIDASGAGVGEDYKWYDALTGGTLLQSSGSAFNTPSISSTTNYYVSIYNTVTGCESASRTQVTATIYAKPIATISGALSACASSGTVLGSVGSSAGSGTITNYQWQLGGVDIPSANLSTLSVFTSGNYNLTISNSNGCSTTSATSSVNISLTPIASGTGTLNTCENGPITISGVSATNGTINWTILTGNGSIINTNTVNPTYIPVASDAGTTVVLRMAVSNPPCSDDVYTQNITIDPRPVLSTNTVNICGGNPTQQVTVLTVNPNTDYKWSPATDLYLDAALTIPYIAGTSATNIWIAPYGSINYNVTATNTISGCTSSPTVVNVTVCLAATNDICQADAVAPIPVTNTAVFYNYSLIGATPSIFASCAPIQRDIYYRVVVPANGEIHVVTSPGTNSTASLNINSSVVSILTGPNCSTASSIACNADGAAANLSYAHVSGLTAGSTAYIRLASTVANNAPTAQFIKMAVTSGLVWTAATDDDFNNSANWHGGDATALTKPDATISVIVPSTVAMKPKLYANSNVRGMNFTTGAPYFSSPGINLNGFTLNVKGDWIVGPSIASTTVLDCNGVVEFNGNGTTAQFISGKTTFGNLTTNNTTSGVTLLNTTSVSCILKSTAGNLNSAGNLILRSTPTITSLVDPASGNITGNVTVERKVGTTSGYHYLSSAVSGAFVNNTINGWRDDFTILNSLDGIVFIPGNTYSQLPSVWEYNETNTNPNAAYGWISATASDDPITPLKGFACVVPGNVIVDVSGPLNNGSISGGYNITKTAGTGIGEGLNAVGNPYPSPISWNAFRALTGNSSLLSTSGYQTFISTGGYNGTYGSWDGAVGSPASVTDKIASSQGVMVTALAAGTINADNTVRLTTAADLNATFFNGYNSVPDLLRLEVQGNGFKNETAIYFDATAEDNYNVNRDVRLIYTPVAGVPNIYSKVDNTPLNINVMGKLNTDKVVPLGLKIQTAGNYNIIATDMTSFAPSVIAYLEDTQAGTMTNLRYNSSYAVTLPAGQINNRFYIHFLPAIELNTFNETCSGNDGKLIINYPTTNTVDIIIKDENGNLVNTQNNFSGTVTINNLSSGNYIAEMTFGEAPNTYTSYDYFTIANGNAVYANLSASSNIVDINTNSTVYFTASTQSATNFNWNFG